MTPIGPISFRAISDPGMVAVPDAISESIDMPPDACARLSIMLPETTDVSHFVPEPMYARVVAQRDELVRVCQWILRNPGAHPNNIWHAVKDAMGNAALADVAQEAIDAGIKDRS